MMATSYSLFPCVVGFCVFGSGFLTALCYLLNRVFVFLTSSLLKWPIIIHARRRVASAEPLSRSYIPPASFPYSSFIMYEGNAVLIRWSILTKSLRMSSCYTARWIYMYIQYIYPRRPSAHLYIPILIS